MTTCLTRSIMVLKQNTYTSFRVVVDVTQTPSGSLNGFSTEFLCKRTLLQPDYSIHFTSTVNTGSIQISNSALGYIDVMFASVDTTNLQPGDYFWELRCLNVVDVVDTRVPDTVYGEIFLLKSL